MSRKLFQATAVVSAMTMVSRVFGYLRDVVIAVSFGATGGTDAFFVAFRIPNFLRRLFAEGAFSQAFVPVFTEYRERRRQTELRDLIDHVAGTLALVLGVVTVLGILAAPVVIAVFAPGFVADQEQFTLASGMLRITFPYLMFISLTALAAGILNSLGRFAVPAFTPVLLNLSLIGAALWLAPHMEDPVTALAWGVFVAGIAQLAFQVPFLVRLGVMPRPRFRRAHEGVRRILRLMVPALLGTSVVQINLLFDTLIASFLAVGSISWLYFSDRFVELPLALFGVAIGTVILPRLSRQHSREAPERFSETLDWALRLALVIALPAMAGLVALAGPILATLIQYRAFSPFDTRMAQLSLMAYAVGLPAFIMIKVLAPGFYSRQDTRTPVRIGIIAMLANMGLNVAFVVPWVLSGAPGPHAGLALATSGSACLNAWLLYRRLRGDGIFDPATGWAALSLRILAAAAAMGLVIWIASPPLDIWSAWPAWRRGVTLAALVALGTVVYAGGLHVFGIRPRELLHGQPGASGRTGAG